MADIPLSTLFAIVLAVGAIMFFIFAIIYIYMSFAYMAIARKAKLRNPGLAWIPFIGPTILAYQSSDMHWWPWLLLIGVFIPYLGAIPMVIFAVYMIIWNWKLFEKARQPGWLAILLIIPIVNLITLGIVAWSKR